MRISNRKGFIDLGITIAIILIVGVAAVFIYFQYFAEKHPLGFLNDKFEQLQEAENKNLDPEFLSETQDVKLLWGSGEYLKSLVSAQELLEKATTNEEKAAAHYWIGLSFYKLNLIDAAEREELLAVQSDPNFGAPYVTLAAISLGKNDCNKAFDYAQKAVAWDSDYAWAHNSLGLAHICLGERDMGIVEIKKAVKLDPDSYVFRNNLQRILEEKE